MKIYQEDVNKSFHYKLFKDFNYLSFEPTTGQMIFVYILTLVVSVVTIIFNVKNEYNEENTERTFYQIHR